MNIKSMLTLRTFVVVGVTALIIALPVLSLAQTPAVAAPPPPLRWPFKFIELPRDAQAGEVSTTVLPSSTVVYSDTFETFFPASDPTTSHPGWQVFTNPGSPNLFWGRVFFSNSIFTNTLWSTGYFSPTQSANSTYVSNLDTWVVYGPLNALEYRRFQAEFDFYSDSDPGAAFGWATSVDGQNFCGQTLSGHVGKWLHSTYDLSPCPNQGGVPVYLAFFFQSDASAPMGLGAFVDNVVIRGLPWHNTFLPFVRRDPTPTSSPTPIASATPPYSLVKSWDFNDPISDSSNEWCSGSSDDWGANKVTMGPNGSGAYFIKSKQDWMLKMLSPLYTTPNNYRITAQFNFLRFNTGYGLGDFGSAQFGLIFGVDGDTFGNDPAPADRCPSDPNTGGYHKFMLKIQDGGGGYVTRLERVANGDWTLLNESNLPTGLSISRSDWNTITLDRNGNGIVVYINGIQVLNYSDATYKGRRWFGLFTQTLGSNRDSAFESDWDNVQVYDLTP